ncbi:MAG: RluA family pseudouridine synthase [Bacilli bacterium]|nr:RluA family pseudouridine synthase [Bacilli bacterium]
MSYFVVKIDKKYDSYSLPTYLSSFYLSTDKIKYLINNNCCFINGVVVKDDYQVKEADELCIDTSFYDGNELLPSEKELNILYEDEYLLIISKPAKCIIYPDDLSKNNTLGNYVLNYYLSNDYDYKVRHAHRLDFDTTGCIVYAKDVITHAAICKMIETKELIRKYLAVVEGAIDKKKDLIDLPIGKNRHVNGKMIVSKTGKRAITSYEVLKTKNNKSLVLLKLETGRTHQIRVHMSHLNHPLVGDELYGAKTKEKRVLLHSYMVEFIHPITNKRIKVIDDMPDEMKKYF